MFIFDPDGERLGEFRRASVRDGVLYLDLRGFKTLRLEYDHPVCAGRELQSIVQAVTEGKTMYTLDNDHRADLEAEDESFPTEQEDRTCPTA